MLIARVLFLTAAVIAIGLGMAAGMLLAGDFEPLLYIPLFVLFAGTVVASFLLGASAERRRSRERRPTLIPRVLFLTAAIIVIGLGMAAGMLLAGDFEPLLYVPLFVLFGAAVVAFLLRASAERRRS